MIALPKSAAQRTACALLAALWIVCIYRAATQSIVHDEALTYQLYLAGPASRMFQLFDANHHFLNTLLMRVSTTLFGFSALTMRLPALLGAAIFFAALYRFCRWMLGDSWRMTIAVAAVALNPFVLDFMVAARGYGLALAFWMTALALLAPLLSGDVRSPRDTRLAGTCAALSVTANLIFLPPVAMLAAIVVWRSIRNPRAAAPAPSKKRAKSEPARPRPLWFDFLLPAAVIAVVFLLSAPLENARGSQFYTGAASIPDSLRSLAEASVAHGGPDAYVALATKSIGAIALGLAPLALLAALIAGFLYRNLALLLISISACGAAILVLALHLAFDFPYPAERTGIYFVPALTLALAAFCALPQRALQNAVCAILLLSIACFALQFDPRFFFVWRYDADSSRIAQRLAELARARPAAGFDNSWELEPSLNFYRVTRHLDSLSPFTRNGLSPGYDYYALAPQDRGLVRDLSLTILYQGPVSGALIAASTAASPAASSGPPPTSPPPAPPFH